MIVKKLDIPIINWENAIKSNDKKQKHKSINELQSYLYMGNTSNVARVENIIRYPEIFETIINILKNIDQNIDQYIDTLILDSLYILINVTGTPVEHHTKFILDLNLIPVLISVAKSDKINIKIHAIWTLINIASSSTEICNRLVDNHIFDILLEICNFGNSVESKEICSHAFQIIVQYSSLSKLKQYFMLIFPHMITFLLFMENETILIRTCSCFGIIFKRQYANSSIINFIITMIYERLITLSLHKNINIAASALNLIREIAQIDKRVTTKFEIKRIEDALSPLIHDINLGNKVQLILGDLVFEQIVSTLDIIPPLIDIICLYLYKT